MKLTNLTLHFVHILSASFHFPLESINFAQKGPLVHLQMAPTPALTVEKQKWTTVPAGCKCVMITLFDEWN